ncbi:unnamed protein product [Timema podura]|uniref:F-box domain-containing protein n=1 Tax=Timema podura TaxID=61482 RepID=A0ABN7NKT9_TIMPD|nr:unnamed protein product [Timema podura]
MLYLSFIEIGWNRVKYKSQARRLQGPTFKQVTPLRSINVTVLPQDRSNIMQRTVKVTVISHDKGNTTQRTVTVITASYYLFGLYADNEIDRLKFLSLTDIRPSWFFVHPVLLTRQKLASVDIILKMEQNPSMPTFEILPIEIIDKIFSYLSPEDLARSVQYVCRKWHQITFNYSLWKNVVFKPDKSISDCEIMEFLHQVPMLRQFAPQRRVRFGHILDVLCRECPDIRSLVLDKRQRVTEKHLTKIRHHFPELQNLCAGFEENVAKACVDVISSFSHLKTLRLNTDYLNKPRSFRPIINHCQLLEHLDLGHYFPANDVSQKDIIYLLRKMKHQLVSLSLTCSELTQEIAQSLRNCTKLQELSIYHIIILSDVKLSEIRHLGNLKSLSLPYLGGGRFELKQLYRPGTWPKLVKLNLTFCVFFGNEDLRDILEYSPNLEELNLHGCETITDDGLEFVYKCPQLRRLNVAYCYGLTDISINYITSCSKLTYLNLQCVKVGSEASFIRRVFSWINIYIPLGILQCHQKFLLNSHRDIMPPACEG